MSQSETLAPFARLTSRHALAVAFAFLFGCGDGDRFAGGFAPASADDDTTVGSSGSTGGQGGAGSSSGAGGDAPSPSNACDENVAFWATGMSFGEPTAEPLAAALNRALYGYDAHGTSIVVQGAAATASVTEISPSGSHVLVEQPSFTDIVEDVGGFRTTEPQATGWLRLHDDHGAIDLELRNLSIDARVGADCSQIVVVLDAIIPTEAGSVAITLDGATATIAELAGGATPSTLGWPLRALFQGESIAFDFGSLSP